MSKNKNNKSDNNKNEPEITYNIPVEGVGGAADNSSRSQFFNEAHNPFPKVKDFYTAQAEDEIN